METFCNLFNKLEWPTAVYTIAILGSLMALYNEGGKLFSVLKKEWNDEQPTNEKERKAKKKRNS